MAKHAGLGQDLVLDVVSGEAEAMVPSTRNGDGNSKNDSLR